MARIRVKVKATGQTGTVEQAEFDPNIYEQVGGSTTDMVSNQLTDASNVAPQNDAMLNQLKTLMDSSIQSGDLKTATTIAGLYKNYKDMFSQQEEKVELSSEAKKRQAILNQAAPVLERVAVSSEQAPAGMGGWLKSAAGRIPGVSGGEAEFLRRQNEGFARLIASAFASEVGVATDKDVKRWQAILPQPGDTVEERKRMLQDLVTQIQNESDALGIPIPPAIKRMTARYGSALSSPVQAAQSIRQIEQIPQIPQIPQMQQQRYTITPLGG